MTSPSALGSPVELALRHYEKLLGAALASPRDRLPSERELAALWKLSQASVNRAAQRLIAAGRMRREGYRLFPVPEENALPLGAKIVVLTPRDQRFPGLPAEGARLGFQLEERFFLGRDEFRQNLQTAVEESAKGVIMNLGDSGWEWDAEHAELERRHIACVVCDEAPPGLALVTRAVARVE